MCRDGSRWRPYQIPRHLPRSYPSSLAEGPDGTVWAGSASEGLFGFKGDKLVSINASSGLSDNSVESLLVDRDGDLWAGTDAGLNLMRQKDLFAFDQRQGLGYGAVNGLAEIAPGVLWVGKPNDGLYRWDGRSFSRVTSADLFIVMGQQINTLLVSRDGGCWMAGRHGLLHFKTPMKTANKAEVVPDIARSKHIISPVRECRHGDLWAGTHEGGLWRLQNQKWQSQTNFVHPITSIVADTNDTEWVGTEGDGVYEFKDGVVAHWDTANGLLSDLVRTLYVDSEGTIWIGTAGGGLS